MNYTTLHYTTSSLIARTDEEEWGKGKTDENSNCQAEHAELHPASLRGLLPALLCPGLLCSAVCVYVCA